MKYITIILIIILIIVKTAAYGIGGDFFAIDIDSNVGFALNNSQHSKQLSNIDFVGGFNKRPLLNLSLRLDGGYFTFLSEASILSLRESAIILDTDSIFTNMVKLGFIEYSKDNIFISVGRRKQSMGVSEYNLFVNESMPFYDGVNLSIGGARGFRFDSLVSWASLTRYTTQIRTEAGYEFSSKLHSKYFIYHALSYTGRNFFVMVGEAAAVANPASLSDFNVFTNAHNEHSSKVNVGLEVQAAFLFFDKLKVYCSLAVDDLPTPFSDTGADAQGKVSHPDAMAASLGFTWQLLEGEGFAYNYTNKGIRRNSDFGVISGGLILGFDAAVATRWMYKKSSSHTAYGDFDGQLGFYNYFYTPNLFAGEGWYAIPYGLSTGGDSALFALSLTYSSPKFSVKGVFQTLLQGWEGRETDANLEYMGEALLSSDPDDKRYSMNWLFSGDIKPSFLFSVEAEYYILTWFSVYLGISGTGIKGGVRLSI